MPFVIIPFKTKAERDEFYQKAKAERYDVVKFSDPELNVEENKWHTTWFVAHPVE